MTNIEKSIILTYAIEGLINQNSSEGINVIKRLMFRLGLTLSDLEQSQPILIKMANEEQYSLLNKIKALNYTDKKLAQQCFVTAFLEGGNENDKITALKFKNLLDLCGMDDVNI